MNTFIHLSALVFLLYIVFLYVWMFQEIRGIKYAVHSHVGVFWDGGVQLLGVHRIYFLARIHCWWHVRVTNPLRAATVVPVRDDAKLEDYCNDYETWKKHIKECA